MSRVFNASGVPQGNEIRINQFTRGNQEEVAITRLGDGSLITVWMSEGQDGSEEGIVARQLTAEGVPQGNEFVVNVTRVGEQNLPSVAALKDGGFIVAWSNVDPNPDTMAREYDADLNLVTGEVQLTPNSSTGFLGPELVSLSNEGVGAVWMTLRVLGFFPTVGAEVRTTRSEVPVSTDNNDTLTYEGESSNILALGGNDWITPGGGSDTIDGGTGFDMVSFINQSQAVRVDLSTGRATSGNGVNLLSNIEGITGSSFGDYIVGDDGNNRLRGAGSYDWFVGSEGADFYDGGTGRDMISYVSSDSAVQVNLERGRGGAGQADGDRYQNIERVTGSSYQDHLTGDAGDNDLRGLGSYDWLVGSAGRDRYDGGSGLDMISYSASTSAVSVFLSQGRGTQGDAARNSYTSVERVTG
ncbi:calcium-binding protein [Phaeobacter sp. NW0010-22]|uniref:calcium-binding protein n=1 Tax=Phaeobacter sp. NW0010-22 TaxID=3135907 RepID=UPI00310966B5